MYKEGRGGQYIWRVYRRKAVSCLFGGLYSVYPLPGRPAPPFPPKGAGGTPTSLYFFPPKNTFPSPIDFFKKLLFFLTFKRIWSE